MKRTVEFLQNQSSYFSFNYNIELFVISGDKLTDYASIQRLNKTFDSIEDPKDLEQWIYIVLDQLVFLHRGLNLFNLDIKPQNIFIGRP